MSNALGSWIALGSFFVAAVSLYYVARDRQDKRKATAAAALDKVKQDAFDAGHAKAMEEVRLDAIERAQREDRTR